jgi:hypothetical protein
VSHEIFIGEEVGEKVEGAAVRVPLWWRAFKGLVSTLLRWF